MGARMDFSVISQSRAIPLEDVLERFGARRAVNDPKRNWKLDGSRITVHGALFYDHLREAGGGGAIDLACHLGGWKFREAVAWLMGDGALPRAGQERLADGGSIASRASFGTDASQSLPPPIPDPAKLAHVRAYLTGTRAIPAAIVERGITKGEVFADPKGNVVFVLRDERLNPVGYELRGTRGKPFHCIAGAKKGLFFARLTRNHEATFVESGIEALSYLALHPNRTAISTTGNSGDLAEQVGRRLLTMGYSLFAGFNADEAGDRMAQRLAERLEGRIQRHRPDPGLGKDWNDHLVARRKDGPRQSNAVMEASHAPTR
jgi:hypothetical protein